MIKVTPQRAVLRAQARGSPRHRLQFKGMKKGRESSASMM